MHRICEGGLAHARKRARYTCGARRAVNRAFFMIGGQNRMPATFVEHRGNPLYVEVSPAKASIARPDALAVPLISIRSWRGICLNGYATSTGPPTRKSRVTVGTSPLLPDHCPPLRHQSRPAGRLCTDRHVSQKIGRKRRADARIVWTCTVGGRVETKTQKCRTIGISDAKTNVT